MAGLRILQPADDSASEMADWIETASITESTKVITRAKLRRRIRNAYFYDDKDDLEIQIDLLIQEMKRREQLVGDQYPFMTHNRRLSLRNNATAFPYSFLLLISTSEPFRSAKRHKEIDEMFDELVADALRSYLGSGGCSVRFGWPPSGDRPAGFSDAMDWLSNRMSIPHGVARRRPQTQDGGVDIVAWRPFKDKWTGFVTILCQCTTAFDWIPKAKDIEEYVWMGWVDFGRLPNTCLAIPFVVHGQLPQWDELRRTVTMLLDRLRICELLEGAQVSRAQDIAAWSANEVTIVADA